MQSSFHVNEHTHAYELREWFRSVGIEPTAQVRQLDYAIGLLREELSALVAERTEILSRERPWVMRQRLEEELNRRRFYPDHEWDHQYDHYMTEEEREEFLVG